MGPPSQAGIAVRPPQHATLRMFLAKVFRRLRLLFSGYPANSKVTALRHELRSRAVPFARRPAALIAVQCVEDPFYVGLFSAVCQQLRAESGAAGELVVVRSMINSGIGHNWLQRLLLAPVGLVTAQQWVRAFQEAGRGVAYRRLSLANPLGDLLDWYRSRRLWRRERLNPDIPALEVLNVRVGDLIIDSYLRFRPAPQFDMSDPFVVWLIWQAHRDIRRSRKYFRTRLPKVFLTSYSTYIDHGIAVRVALQEGVRVRSFGNFTQFGKELTHSDWFHTPDTARYRSDFAALDRREERCAEAQKQLSFRLSGGIDPATSYMRASAYAGEAGPLPDVNGAVIVFLHDFYDSPHVYDGLIFPDFWAWASLTIDTLEVQGRNFFIKPHPNQIQLSDAALERLRRKYPALPLLSSGVSNARLADAGMLCGVTVYGTVGHELAYLGVPTIACARHPHHAFDFCRTARTIEEYVSLLRTPEILPVPKDEMRRQALEFYYMHNLHGDSDTLALRKRFIDFWRACNRADATDAGVVEHFRALRDSKGFKAQTARLL